MNVTMPMVGDFHYIGHKLLAASRLRRGAWASYRINPAKSAAIPNATRNSPRSSRPPLKYRKPVRIGVNWGSLDQELLTG